VENIKGYLQSQLPISIKHLNKIADLIEFEGPILSHFKDDKGKDYLFNWVDHDDTYNRWLIWKINSKQLYNFLKNHSSLKDLLLETNKDFVYSADIDQHLQYSNIHAIEINDIDIKYVPDENDMFAFDIPKVYELLIQEFEKDPYLQVLKEKSIYFKWSTRKDAQRFVDTVGAADAGGFLTKISKSFLKYAEYSFYEKYRETIGDFSKLNKIITQLKEVLQPRVVDLAYGSFEVALSSDTINDIDGTKYYHWQNTILERYQNDVIDVDYSSPVELAIIKEQFPDEVRKDIFGPIISIINDSKYQLEVVNYKRTFKRNYSKITKLNEKYLVPEPILQDHIQENKKLYTIIFEAPEGAKDNIKFSKKQLQENTLFTQENDDANFEKSEFIYDGLRLKLSNPLNCKLFLLADHYKLECDELNIKVEGSTSKEAFDQLEKSVYEFFNSLYSDIDPVAPDLEKVILRDKYIDRVISIERRPLSN
jgi:hypothetical protein